MDEENLYFIEEMERQIRPIQVPDCCSFWMIRTKSGAYYNEYIRNGYIAIGWNAILRNNIEQDGEEKMRQAVELHYADKRPGAAINKCYSFVTTMRIGDIVMILGDKRVAFGIVGEYFEKQDIQEGIKKELEADSQIAEGLHKQVEIKCPYIKRRQIQMIKEVEEGRLTPLLVRAMLNHQSLSEISMYAVPVLNTCFDLYVYKEETHVVFRVNTRNRIKGRDFSTFSYYITEIFATINDDNDVSITMNLNSPGDYVVAFQKTMEFIQQNWFAFLFVYLILFGGSYEKDGVKTDIPSVRGLIKWSIQHKHEAESKSLETEKLKGEIDGIKLDNEMKKIQIQKAKKEALLDAMPENRELEKMQKASQALDLQKPDPKIIIFPSANQEDHKDGSS